jgi:tetratricopeptide (TPR) repeat protein
MTRKTMLGILLLAMILTSCTGPGGVAPSPVPSLPSVKKDITQDDLLLVDQLILAGKYEQAILAVQTLLQIAPTSPELQMKLKKATGEWRFSEAQALQAAGNFSAAISKLKDAQQLLPSDRRILFSLDENYLSLGKQQLDLMDPANAKASLLQVVYDSALKAQAQGLLKTEVPAVEFANLGSEALQNGNLELALSYFEQALALKPEMENAKTGKTTTEKMIAERPAPIPTPTPSVGPTVGPTIEPTISPTGGPLVPTQTPSSEPATFLVFKPEADNAYAVNEWGVPNWKAPTAAGLDKGEVWIPPMSWLAQWVPTCKDAHLIWAMIQAALGTTITSANPAP